MIFSFLISLSFSLLYIEPSTDLDYNYNQNQGFQSEVGKTYYRLPPRAQKLIRSQVWGLSRCSSSISIKFISNSSRIRVEYQREASHYYAMMNKLGTCGIDLYGYDENGTIHFFSASYVFQSKSATFDFTGLNGSSVYTYLLILPSYEIVVPSKLKIGYEEGSFLKIFESELDRPVTLYGTSIMHGACPNRPGLSWVNWMSRHLQLPVHNFGFRGQGILEKNVIDFIVEEEASVFVLDCLPNLVFDSVDKTVQLTIAAYNQIRGIWPNTPIILVEYGRYTNYEFNNQYKTYSDNMNQASKIAFQNLLDQNATNLYTVTYEDLGMLSDDISDSVHPTDLGMKKQADALEKAIREILHMPKNDDSHPYVTQYPAIQHRNLDFAFDHQNHLKLVKSIDNTEKVIIGDCAVAHWENDASWEQMKSSGFINLGVKKDRIENVLYRIYHDEIYSGYIQPKSIVGLIGSNNLPCNNNTEIIEGIKFLFDSIQIRQPNAKINIVGILPRSGFENRIKEINTELQKIASAKNWGFADPGANLLDQTTGLINKLYFDDDVNLNSQGYAIIAPIIAAL